MYYVLAKEILNFSEAALWIRNILSISTPMWNILNNNFNFSKSKGMHISYHANNEAHKHNQTVHICAGPSGWMSFAVSIITFLTLKNDHEWTISYKVSHEMLQDVLASYVISWHFEYRVWVRVRLQILSLLFQCILYKTFPSKLKGRKPYPAFLQTYAHVWYGSADHGTEAFNARQVFAIWNTMKTTWLRFRTLGSP